MNNESIYCIGLGGIAAYYNRGDIKQVFGAPYGTGSMFELNNNMDMDRPAVRRPKTGIWDVELFQNGEVVADITDFAAMDTFTMVRRIEAKRDIEFSLEFLEESGYTPDSFSYLEEIYPEAKFAVSLLVDPGYHSYYIYPFPYRQYYFISAKGNISWKREGNVIKLIAHEGVSEIYFTGSTKMEECNKAFERTLLSGAYERMEEESKEYWNKFFIDHSVEALVPNSIPHREKLFNAIESTIINICSQQSKEGAVIAGHNYHMGYVRDQYGTSRGLISMNCVEEAKNILKFYKDIFDKFGQIKNAQGIGAPGMFHIHEYDEAEITGYLIYSAFDIYGRDGDDEFLQSLLPMLSWAVDEQISVLHNGMMPFNGDETYIAGRIFPRTSIDDGSLEATILFIESAEMFLKYFGEMLDADKKEKYELSLKEVKDKFDGNFIEENNILINNPKRLENLEFKDYRPGVCLGNYNGYINDKCKFTGWNKHVGDGVYLCMSCISQGINPRFEHKKYNVRSVVLSPKYMNSTIISDELLNREILEIADNFISTGVLPSDPAGNKTVGYDYGFLLYNLVGVDQEKALYVYEKALELLDETGAWVEYYVDGKPQGTMYRPWESGINIEAIIKFANYYYN